MNRIERLRRQLDGPCLIENPVDLFYLTGMVLSKGRLLVTGSTAILYVDGRYYAKAKKEASCDVLIWEEQKKITEKRIYFDSAVVSFDGYSALKREWPKIEWIPFPNILKKLRAIKEKHEIEALQRAADLTWRGYQHIVANLKEGVAEEALALEFEIFCRRNGASGLSFEPIIAFGENSAYPHYRAGKSRLQKGQVVLIDIGAVVDDYHADMTRIYYFGEPDPKIVHFEKIVKAAQRKAIDYVKPGVKVGELDQIVINEFEKANVKPLYMHSLGHGVGLETHEFPRIKHDGEDRDVILEPGMTITIEPGLYQPGVGGVRIEDMILVTETGHENFFKER